MSDVAIRVESLSKRYRIGACQECYYTLRDAVTRVFAAFHCCLAIRHPKFNIRH